VKEDEENEETMKMKKKKLGRPKHRWKEMRLRTGFIWLRRVTQSRACVNPFRIILFREGG
jgi:hypothetical protein